MVRRLFTILAFLLLHGALAQSELPGTVVRSQFVQSFPPAQIDSYSARLYSRVSHPNAVYGVDQYLITYLSTDTAGNPAEIVAQLFIPRLERLGNLPIYVMGAGTTGIAPQCAISREVASVRNWGDYRTHMLSYAAQGYISILFDYHGFNSANSPQSYFVADLESRAMLDAARAVYRIFENAPLLVAPGPEVFLAGYSQGGHAVFGATEMAPQYAPELNIVGAIGYAPATSVEALMRDTPYLTPYILYAYAYRYGEGVVNPAAKLNPRWLASFERDVMGKCVDEVDTHYGRDARAVYRPEFYAALYGGRLAEAFPELKAVLDKNATGLVRGDVPALIIQGGADPIVSTTAQDHFVRRHCALGADLTYRVYDGVHHFQARQYGFRDTLQWMESVLYNRSRPSDCPRILSQSH